MNKKLNNPKIVLIDPNANKIKESLSGKGYKKLSEIIHPVDIGIDDSEIIDKLQLGSVNLR